MKILLIALAGALGALARWGLAGIVQARSGFSFPVGTAVVNILGCFLFGVIVTLAEERFVFSAQVRIMLLTGFLGAFTTFSTYTFETAGLISGGQPLAALANAAGQVIFGLSAFFLGRAIVRLFFL
jgi:CrcB protein